MYTKKKLFLHSWEGNRFFVYTVTADRLHRNLINLFNKDVLTAEQYKKFYLATIEILDDYEIFLKKLSKKFVKEGESIQKKPKEERIDFVFRNGISHELKISTPIGKQFFDKNISVDKIFRILQYCFRMQIISFDVYFEIVELNKGYFSRFDEGLFKIGKFVKQKNTEIKR
jgi:hypothetical protein